MTPEGYWYAQVLLALAWTGDNGYIDPHGGHLAAATTVLSHYFSRVGLQAKVTP